MAKRRKTDLGNRYRLRVTKRGLIVAIAVPVLIAAATAYLFLSGGDEGRERRALRQEPVVTDALQSDVRVVDRDYEPRDLTAPRGATITWVQDGEEPHNVIDDRGRFESPILRTGDEWSMTFDEPGDYYYYCSLHHVMLGTLRIAE